MGSEVWASGAAYEPYVGRWSRLVAAEFLGWLDVAGGGRWVDVGCGTGAVTEVVLKAGSPRDLISLDTSEQYVRHAEARVRDPRVNFAVGGAAALPLADGVADASVSGLVLNFVTEPDRAAAEMARVTRPGGVVGAYVWDYAGEMQLMRHFWDAAGTLDPRARQLDEGRRFPLCRPATLDALLRNAGLADTQVRAIDVPTVFRDFDDYWTPFLGGQAPAPAYAMSLGERERAELRERIRAGLPHAANGSIPLIARAWAVKGRA